MQVEKGFVKNYVVIFLEHYIFLVVTVQSLKTGGRSAVSGLRLKHGVDFLE